LHLLRKVFLIKAAEINAVNTGIMDWSAHTPSPEEEESEEIHIGSSSITS
jgi:hypothetical protein